MTTTNDPKFTPTQVHDGVLDIARQLEPSATSETQLQVLVRDTFIPMVNAKFFRSNNGFEPSDFSDTDTVGTVMIQVALSLKAQHRLVL